MNTLWHYELIVLVLQAGACPYIANSMRVNRGSWLVVVMMARQMYLAITVIPKKRNKGVCQKEDFRGI